MQLKRKANVIGLTTCRSLLQYINNKANRFIMENILMNCAAKINLKVNLEFRFLKSLAQERFKSNLELRYQIILSSIKFRKVFAKFMILIAFFKEVS